MVEAGTVVSTGVTDADTGWAASVGDVAADPPPDVPRASAPHPATPAKATTAATAGAHRRMLVGSTGGTSAAPLRFVCDGPRVQGEPAVGGALMVPTGLRADLAGIGARSQALRVQDRSSRNDLPAGGPPGQVRATGWMARSSCRRANISFSSLTITDGELRVDTPRVRGK